MFFVFCFSGADGGQRDVRSQRAWRCRVLRRHPRLHAYTHNNCKERSGRPDPPLHSSRYADTWWHLYPLFSSQRCAVCHLEFPCLPQATFSVKPPPSHPTVTRRSGSRPVGGKRLWSTAGTGSSSALGAPTNPRRDCPRRQQEGSPALARWTCSRVLKLLSGIWRSGSQTLWPTWNTLGTGKTPTVVQGRKVMKEEGRV